MAAPKKQPARKPAAKKSSSAKSSRPAAKTARPSVWRRHERDLWLVLFGLVGIFLLLADVGALGPVGRVLAAGLGDVVGLIRFVLPIALLLFALSLVKAGEEFDYPRWIWSLVLGLIATSGLADLAQGRPAVQATSGVLRGAGGLVGALVGSELTSTIGLAGALVVLIALLVVSVMLATGVGLRRMFSLIARVLRALGRGLFGWMRRRPVDDEDLVDYDEEEYEEEPDEDVREPEPVSMPEPFVYEPDLIEEEPAFVSEVVDEPTQEIPVVVATEVDDDTEVSEAPHSEWTLPPVSLLQRTKEQRTDKTAIETAGAELVAALAAHGVATTLLGYTVGPAVTRYELELGAGVKVSKLTSLNKDIAYAMASPDVRILAPIPGRSAIGVEVPNRQRTLVALGDLMVAEETQKALHPLDVPIGRDISGKTVIVNMGTMPHVLISGATGAGKSSCINGLLTSLVMRATPDQLRLVLIDPKRVELNHFNDLPHLIAPVVVDPKKAAGMLAWAVKEMESRYSLLAECGARDIAGYLEMLDEGKIHRRPQPPEEATGATESFYERLPYIVIVVDELNDLMMIAPREVEESVVRIAQMARAVGIHLVLATQRPSVDVITGVIKANIPSRMAFAVSSLADSRVILDQGGAERLIGKGDMLLLTASSNIAQRIQSPWVSEDEVRRVVDSWRAQGGQPESIIAVEVPSVGASAPSSSFGGGGSDEDEVLLARAREIVITHQSGSTSLLQRKLRVGFARAGRLMDELENMGVVGPGDGSKARKVLMDADGNPQVAQ